MWINPSGYMALTFSIPSIVLRFKSLALTTIPHWLATNIVHERISHPRCNQHLLIPWSNQKNCFILQNKLCDHQNRSAIVINNMRRSYLPSQLGGTKNKEGVTLSPIVNKQSMFTSRISWTISSSHFNLESFTSKAKYLFLAKGLLNSGCISQDLHGQTSWWADP